jgi:hypothetical protein
LKFSSMCDNSRRRTPRPESGGKTTPLNKK